MAIYQVTLRQSYVSQKCINRFTYVSTVEPTGINGSNVLAELIGCAPLVDSLFPAGSLLLSLQSLQNTNVHFEEVEVINLYDDADFFVYPFTGDPVGVGGSGDSASPFLAYGFYSNRVTRAIRRGFKRFVGLSEGTMVAGGFIESGAQATMVTIADEMSAVLNPDNTLSHGVYTPAIASYERHVDGEGKVTYKPYATEGAQLAHTAVGVTWDYYDTVRSQVSRQYGRGQ